MSTGKKITIGVLLLLTLILAGVSTFIALSLNDQGTSQNEDVGVAGFGEAATRDIYEQVYLRFGLTECEDILNRSFISSNSFRTNMFNNFISVENNLEQLGLLEYLPLSCTYNFGNNSKLRFSVFTYDIDSEIAESREALYSRINSFDSIIDEGTTNNTDYFIGVEEDRCITNMFQLDNEFEYAQIEYSLDGVECNQLVSDNDIFVEELSSFVDLIVKQARFAASIGI